MAAVRWLEGNVHNRPKAGEITPEKAALTDGDCVSQEILLVALNDRFPHVTLDVEEDTPSVGLFAQKPGRDRVVIDPIDGTLRYLLGDGRYAILVGLERDERVEASLIGLPQTDVLIRAVRGDGTEISRSGGPFEPVRAEARGAELYVSHSLDPELARSLDARGYKRVTSAGAGIAVAPLLDDVCAGVRIMDGPAGMSRRIWVASLATTEAGGRVEALAGELPERHEPGIPGLIAAPDADGIAALREVLT
jgi:hypothetical protein